MRTQSFTSGYRYFAHPLVLFLGVWGACYFLFNLHLSEWFDFQSRDVSAVIAWVCWPFLLGVIFFEYLSRILPKKWSARPKDINDAHYLQLVESRINRWFYCWLTLSLIEAVYCHGLPILWLLTGDSRVYTEYGLPVIHVFLWALLAVLAMSKFGIYLYYGNPRRLFIPCFQIFWGGMIVSRGLIMGALVQAAILWLCIRGVKLRALFRSSLVVIFIVLMFGYMGDARSGGSAFREIARPTSSYPSWLPSGFLWFYIYITSPLANLVNTTQTSVPDQDITFSHTIVFALPTPLRDALYGKKFSEDQQAAGDLITSSLTVSSAYVGPFLDYGFVGMGCYSALLGFLSAYCWNGRTGFRNMIRYVIIGQCLVFSIFWNFLFYMPLLGQIFWIYLLFARRKLSILPTVNKPPLPIST